MSTSLSDLDAITIKDVAECLGLRIVQQGQKCYCACPVTNHEHDEANPRCQLGGERPQLWFCHKCGEAGDAVGLVKAVRQCDTADAFGWLRDAGCLPERQPGASPPPRPQDPLRELADKRGWTAEALEALGAVAHRQDGRPAEVRFPMRDADGGITGWRRRRADGREFGPGRKAMTRKGDKAGLLIPWPLPDGDPVLLVEGETDAAAALSAGHAATVATPGACGRAPRSYLAKLLAGRAVVLAPDPDTAGREWRDGVGVALLNARCQVRHIAPDGDQDLNKRLRAGADLSELVAGALRYEPVEDPSVEFFEGKRFLPLKLARALAAGRVLRFGYAAGADGAERGHLMHYKCGLWHQVAGLVAEAMARLGGGARPALATEAVRALELDTQRIPWNEWDRQPEHFIACKNGLVNLATGELEPHRPDYLCRSGIPWEYHPNAWHDGLAAALKRLFPGRALRELALMVAGYCLTPHKKAKALVFLHGPTDSGKTTFLMWLRGLVGAGAYSLATPQDLTESRFGPAALEGKLANLPDELGTLTLRSVERLKALTGGGGTFTVEHKGLDPYVAPMTATLIFACNALPTGAGEADDAYYNRLLILPFERRIPEAEQDPALRDEWPHDQQVMGAFLAMAIEGLRALRTEHHWRFPKPERVALAVEDYRRVNDPLSTFLETCCVLLPEAMVRRSAFCEAFEQFCREQGIAAPSRKEVLQRLRNERHVQEPVRDGVRWLRGIGLTSGAEGDWSAQSA